MRLSGFHMPGWWQSLWRRRYPMTALGHVDVNVPWPGDGREGPARYRIEPMACGCGYCVYDEIGIRVGEHRPTLGGAIRQARKHAQERSE